MDVLKKIIASLICITCFTKSAQGNEKQNNLEILNRVWSIGSTKACTNVMRKSFSEEAKKEIISKLKDSNNIDDLALLLNPFLFSLGKSHTEFLTTSSESYYFFKSLMAMDEENAEPPPFIINPGIQLGKDKEGYFVREVLSGFPADKNGIKKKDRIISINGSDFNGSWGNSAQSIKLKLQRRQTPLDVELEVQKLDWNQAFQNATKNSVKVLIGKNGKKIGYIHLWSGSHPKSADLLRSSVNSLQREKISGLILDLRGGYGGAWWDHLDPFYADTKNYMQMELNKADGKTEILKSPYKKNKNSFSGPMVVLVNKGVRSGKEAMAYQFKKTKRATLIGEKTPGYFTTGQYFFAEEKLDYVFYLCVYCPTLDGNEIEGKGIEPDIKIPFESTGPYSDSQLEKGVEYF